MLAKVALPRSARTRTCFLRENPAMDRLVGTPEPTHVVRCLAVNAQQAQPLTKCQSSWADRGRIINAKPVEQHVHFKDFTLLQRGNTLQTLVF
jgi:hypothetical protein